MKALIGIRQISAAASLLLTAAIFAGCINPKPRPVPTPNPTPSRLPRPHKTPSTHKTPAPTKAPKTPAGTPSRFTQDPSGDQLQKLISTPQGEAKLRAWMDSNGLKNVAAEVFIRADNYAPQRKTAASALVP